MAVSLGCDGERPTRNPVPLPQTCPLSPGSPCSGEYECDQGCQATSEPTVARRTVCACVNNFAECRLVEDCPRPDGGATSGGHDAAPPMPACKPGTEGNLTCDEQLAPLLGSVAVCEDRPYGGLGVPRPGWPQCATRSCSGSCAPGPGACLDSLGANVGGGICDERCGGCRHCASDAECKAAYGEQSWCSSHCLGCAIDGQPPGCI